MCIASSGFELDPKRHGYSKLKDFLRDIPGVALDGHGKSGGRVCLQVGNSTYGAAAIAE
jgi:hypothetical protein